METYTIIGTIFLELLIAALASLAFLLFLREYNRRKHPAMAWFAAAAGIQFLLNMAHFFAQYVASNGMKEWASLIFGGVMVATVIQWACVIEGVFSLRKMNKVVKGVLLAVSVGTGLFAVYQVVLRPPALWIAQGIPFIAKEDPLRDVVAISALAALAAIVLLVVTVRKEYAASGKSERFTSILMLAVGSSFVIRVAIFLMEALMIDELVYVSLALTPVSIVALYIGALACADQDPKVHMAPFMVVKRDLLTKSFAVISIVMLFMAFVIHATVSVNYIEEGIVANVIDLKHEIDRHVDIYEAASSRLVEEVARFAVDPGVLAALSVPEASMQDRLYGIASEFIWRKSGSRSIIILDKERVVLFSGTEKSIVGKQFMDSGAVKSALSGDRLVGVERSVGGEWMIRAAVPVEIDGNVSHVAVIEERLGAQLMTGKASHGIQGSMFGLVLSNGEVPYTEGESVDRLFTHQVGQAIAGRNEVSIVNTAGDQMYAQRLVAADGMTIGYFYAMHRHDIMLAGIFSSVAFVSFLVITGAILNLIIIYLLLARVLRPLQSLRDAAEHIENERYDVRIDYKGTDELGELASSFNRMQDTIERRTKELKVALREQQDFVDHTARELRNPVNIFRWTLELMRFGDTGRLNKDQLELLEQLHQTNERLFKVVQNLQDAVRIDQGKFKLKFLSVVVEDVVDEVAGMVAVRARSKGVTLHWNRPSKPLPAVRADGVYLLKIVHNIVSNAIKYTLKGGHVEVAVEVVDEASPGGKKGKFIKVSVEDNGIGIPQAEQVHIYERFYRAKNAIEGEIPGTGLGLFIAKNVIERHGGAIWFKSREEVGTTFSITIPIDGVSSHHTMKS